MFIIQMSIPKELIQEDLPFTMGFLFNYSMVYLNTQGMTTTAS